ncbi:neuropeptide FF receptor 2 [Exaiptasia diaphana]|uniref:G-protein coupled receptors family 1 profile domain-containing protein n=1 Tax=Exaiptasia diaphana TaxID=2652724 RepID=A0A913YHW8_EXADI|nr:neuropeptide FF receptor 2 [Exaiptasia diaphana]XP_028514964.1 neuropeptide FF receptor 2 [Exaiptasia diaphana]XP_028514965.1 neuropeptide FF receptor 2 [Exaiptasia diaphana]
MTSASNNTNSSANNNSRLDVMAYCTEYLNLKEETQAETILKLTAYMIAFTVAVIGNVLVIVIVLRKTQFKTTTNLFIINMAFSDVIMALACIPITMYAIGYQNIGQAFLVGWFGRAICKLIPFVQGLSIAVSILTLTTLAGDRFVAIVYPFRNFISKSRAKILILIIWFVGSCFNAPTLYNMRLHEDENTPYCRENWQPYFDNQKSAKIYTIVLFVFLYAVPLMLITFFYAALIRELWQGSTLHSNQTRAFSENKSVLKMVLTVVVIFAVSWLPIHVVPFVTIFATDPDLLLCGVSPTITFIGWFMGHASSAINPVVYLVFNDNFRREVLKLFGHLYQKCLKRRQVISERPFPESRTSTTRQTHAVSISSNDDKSTAGRANDAFEMVAENGTAEAT